MATRDFRSQQIRITQIIASGTNPSMGPSLLIYSASNATNDQGSTNAALTAGAGSDTWLFISGSTKTGDGEQILFGGNIVTSGSLTGSEISSLPDAKLKIKADHDMNFHIDMDANQTSEFAFFTGPSTEIASIDESGNLNIAGGNIIGGAAASNPAITVNALGHVMIGGGNTAGTGVSGKTHTATATLHVPEFIKHTGDLDTLIQFEDNQVSLKAGSIDMVRAINASQDELKINKDFNDVDFGVFSANNGGSDNIRIIQTDANTRTIKFFDNNADAGIGNRIVENDVNFKVIGQTNTKNTTTRGTALFTGDLVVSGTLYADRQVVEVDLVQSGSELILSSAIHFKNSGPGAGGNFPVPNNDGSLFVSTGSIHAKLRNASGVEEIRLQEYRPGNGITATSGSASDISTFHLSIAALTGSALGAHELASNDLLAIADENLADERTRKMTLETFSDTMAGRGLITRASSSLSGPGLMANDGIVAHLTGSEFNGTVGVTGALGAVGSLSIEQGNRFYLNGFEGDVSIRANHNDQLTIDADNRMLLYADDEIWFFAGGQANANDNNYTRFEYGASRFNAGMIDADFYVNTDDEIGTLFVDGNDNSVILGAADFSGAAPNAAQLANKGYGDDVRILLSGSSGAKLAGTRGVVVVPGDLVTSGTNYFENTQITGSLQTSGSIALEIHKPLYFNGLGGDISIVGSGSVSDGVAGGGRLTIDADDILDINVDETYNLGIGGNHAHSSNLTRKELGKTVFNFYTNDVDFMVNTDDYTGTLFIDGNDNTVIIGAQHFDSTPAASELLTKGYGNDVKILLSGTVGTKNTATRGVVVTSGDMVVSGGLYDGTGLHYIKNANEGLFNNSGTAQLNINTLSTSGTPHQDDSFAFIDANDSNATKKGTIEDLSTAIAGDGLSQVAKQLQVNVDGSTIERNSDAIRVKDSGITAAKIATAVAGQGLLGGGGAALSVNPGNGLKFGHLGSGEFDSDKVIVDNTIVATLTGSQFNGVVGVTGSLMVTGSLFVTEHIYHSGSTTTNIRFRKHVDDGDIVTFNVNNVEALKLREDGVLSEVVVNEGGNANLDFRVESDNKDKIIYVNSGLDYISIGKDVGHNGSTGVQPDNHLFISGAIGGITDGGGVSSEPGGVTTFGGDVVVSGTLYDANHITISKKSFDENGAFSVAPNATGTDAVAIGSKTVASGNRSLAIGSTSTGTNTAGGLSSVVLGGEDCQIASAASYGAILGGLNNEITAGGEYGVIMGEQNTVSAARSVAIGKGLIIPVANTIALGNNENTATVVASGSLKVNADATFRTDVAITGSLDVAEYIRHIGDDDTAIYFLNDKIRLQVGTKKNIKVNTDAVLILSGGNSAAAFQGDGNDVAFYVSGSTSSQGTTTRGTSLFGGDVHISGALSGPTTYSLGDSSVRMFRDGSTLKFDDGENAVKTLSELASLPASTDFFVGVHGEDSSESKLKATSSIAFSGDLNNYVDGLQAHGVGQDVFVFFSGSIGSKDGTTRGVTLFGGDTVFSGSTGFTNVAANNNVVATGSLIAGGNKIKNSGGQTSLKFNPADQGILLGHDEGGSSAAQTFLDIRKNDDQQFVSNTDGNTYANYNLALRNHSTTAGAFAGIAFDVQDTDNNNDAIGASIVATRDPAANSGQFKANLLFNTNDGSDDDLTTRMIVDHTGSVGIGRTNPIGALHVDGGDVTFAGNAGSTDALAKAHALTVDYSSGRVGIHTEQANVTDKLTITGDNTAANGAGGNNTLSVNVYNNSGDADIVIRKARGSIASPSVITQAVNIGGIYFEGHDGSDFEPAAAIKGTIDNNLAPGSNDMPGNLRFYTTADGANSLTEHMRINAPGQLLVGPAGAFVGANSEKLIARNVWNAGTTPTPQLGLYNDNNSHIQFTVDKSHNTGIDFSGGSDGVNQKLSISGSLEVLTNLGFFNSDGSANGATVNTILDEDNLSTDSNTALATQQSIKAYVDAQVTAQDLDLSDGSTAISIDLDSETLTIAGTANEVTTTASGNTLTVGLPNDVTVTGDLTVGGGDLAFGNAGNATIDVGNVSGTNVAGKALTIQGGGSTGNEPGGSIFFKVTSPGGSGDSANAYVTEMQIDDGVTIPNKLVVDTNLLYVDGTANRVGIGVSDPDSALEILNTGAQLKLSYDGSNAAAFTVTSNGDLTIAPSGGDTGLTGNLDVSGRLAVGDQASVHANTAVVIDENHTMTAAGASSLKILGAISTNNNADKLLNSTDLVLLQPDSITLGANTDLVSTIKIGEPNIGLSGNSLDSAASLFVNSAPTEATGDFLHPSGSSDFYHNFSIAAGTGRSSFASGSFGLYTSRTDQLIYERVDSSFDSGLAGVFAAGFDNDVPATRNQLATYDGLNTGNYAISLNGTVAQKSFDQFATQTIYRSFASSQTGNYGNFNPGLSPEGKVKSFSNTFYKVPGNTGRMGVPIDIKGTVSDASSTLEIFFVAGHNGMDTGERIKIHYVTDTNNFATAHDNSGQRTTLTMALYVANGSNDGWTSLGVGSGNQHFFEPYDDIGTAATDAKWMKLVLTDNAGGSLQSLAGLLFENEASSSSEIFRIANMHVLHTGNSTQLAHSTDGPSSGFNTAIELTHAEQKGIGAAFRTVYVLAGKGGGTQFNRQYAGDNNKMAALGNSDGLVIQFSLDNGSTYFTPATPWYKSSITGGPPSFTEDVAGSSNTWSAQSNPGKLLGSEISATDYEWFAFNLPGDETNLTNFRMRLACDSSTEGAGLAISDIRVSRYAQGGLNISSDSDNDKVVISCDNGSSDVEFSSRGYNSEHSTVTWLKYDASAEKVLVKGSEVFTPAFISVTATETSDSLSGNKTVFHKDNYPDDNISFDQHVAQGITYDNTTGRFTVDKAGTYEVTFVGVLQGHSTGCDLQIYVNGAEEVQITTQVHTTVDPVERTIHGMFAVADAGYFQILVNDASGGTFNTGSTINIKRIG